MAKLTFTKDQNHVHTCVTEYGTYSIKLSSGRIFCEVFFNDASISDSGYLFDEAIALAQKHHNSLSHAQ